MANRRYKILVERDPETSLFAARCLKMNVFSQGRTEKEALRNIRETIKLHMEVLDEEASGKRLVEVEV